MDYNQPLPGVQPMAAPALSAQGPIQAFLGAQQQKQQQQLQQQNAQKQALSSALSSMSQMRMQKKWHPTSAVVGGNGEVLANADGSSPDQPQMPDLMPFQG